MKKWLIALMVMLTALLACASAGAEDYRLIINENGVITEYMGELPAELVIPGEINGIKVTGIGVSAFKGGSMTSVMLPEGCTVLYPDAFFECTKLASVTLPNSLTSIGDMAFYYCTSLRDITFSHTRPDIADRAFEGCYGVTFHCYKDTKVAVWAWTHGFDAKYIDAVDDTADFLLKINEQGEITGFSGKRPTHLVIPSEIEGIPVTSIGEWSLYNIGFLEDDNLESVVIPEGVTHIGAYAFNGCFNLRKVTLPDTVTVINDWTFHACSKLTTVNWSANLNSIGAYAFDRTGFKSLVIPDSVTTIGDGAFAACEKLQSIKLPASLVNIGSEAFYYCDSLTEIVVPKGVTSIGDRAFECCYGLKSMKLPASIVSIGDGAFSGCREANITIPANNNLAYIGDSAFSQCAAMKKFTIPAGIQKIGAKAFDHCSKLEELTFNCETLPTMGKNAFANIFTKNCTVYCFLGTEVETWAQKQGFVVKCSHFKVNDEVNDPTCTEDGWQSATYCRYCGKVLSKAKVLPALGHDETITEAILPTCTETGLSEGAHCSRCGVTLVQQEVLPLHSMTIVITPAVDPTCTLAGLSEGRHCSACGEVFAVQEIIPALGHKVIATHTDLDLVDGDALALADLADLCIHGDDFVLTGESSNTAKLAIVNNKLCALDTGYATMQLDIRLPDGFGTNVTISALIHARKTMTLPADLTEIGAEAFRNTAAEEFIIPDGVTSIGSCVFANSSLKLLHLPASVEAIAEDAFGNCDVTFIVAADSYAEAYAEEHGIPFVVR